MDADQPQATAWMCLFQMFDERGQGSDFKRIDAALIK
jgi:hypothetical protein